MGFVWILCQINVQTCGAPHCDSCFYMCFIGPDVFVRLLTWNWQSKMIFNKWLHWTTQSLIIPRPMALVKTLIQACIVVKWPMILVLLSLYLTNPNLQNATINGINLSRWSVASYLRVNYKLVNLSNINTKIENRQSQWGCLSWQQLIGLLQVTILIGNFDPWFLVW